MTPKQLREWLFHNSQVDQWWLSLESVTGESPFTVSEIEELISGGQYTQALVLHVSQEDLTPPPWVDVDLPYPPQQSSRLAPDDEGEPQLPPLTTHSTDLSTLTTKAGETKESEEENAEGEGKSGQHHLMWVVFNAVMAWLSWDSTAMWGWASEIFIVNGLIQLILFIRKLDIDTK